MTWALVVVAFWVGVAVAGAYFDGVEERLRASSRELEERLRAGKGVQGDDR